MRALEEQVVQIQGVIDSFLDSQLQTLRGSMGVAQPGSGPAGGARGQRPRRPAPRARRRPPGLAPADQARPGRQGARQEPGRPRRRAPAPGRPATPTEGTERTAVVITGVPHFSRARALWQAIQEVPGVAEAKATNYQGGVLALEVQHDPALDLPGASPTSPACACGSPRRRPGEVRLSAGRRVTRAVDGTEGGRRR